MDFKKNSLPTSPPSNPLGMYINPMASLTIVFLKQNFHLCLPIQFGTLYVH